MGINIITAQNTHHPIKKMKATDDPEVFINEREKIGMRMRDYFNMDISEDDMVSRILNSLPPVYEDLVDSIHIQMNSTEGVSLVSLK